MRRSRPFLFIFVCFILCTAFAAAQSQSTITLRVADPQGAAVPNARVSLATTSGRSIAIAITSAEGVATFRDIAAGKYRAEILATGFRPAAVDVTSPAGTVTATLQVAAAPQTVVVTAAGTPLAAEDAGVAVSAIDAQQIATMNEQETSEVVRFLPGAYVADAGQRGGLTTLFVRGGESRYNKAIVDGVPVNDPGGTFNFAVVPVAEFSRLELLRGAESTLYGSDAMTSVVQTWSATGTTRDPLFKFGADGGTFATAHGYGSVSGARGRFDYNVFGDQFHTDGQGVNDAYFNSLQGTNVGVQLSPRAALRFRLRHSNSRTGVQGAWHYATGDVPPDTDQYARQNDLVANADLNVAFATNWLNRFSVFDYHHRRSNIERVQDGSRPFDDPFDILTRFNRAGAEWQSEITERTWARTIFGYHFENESGRIDDTFVSFGTPGESHTPGVRRNHAVYGEQVLTFARASFVGGLRFEHNESFGNRAVPRISGTYVVRRGGSVVSNTRIRATYSEGIKAPTFEESFGVTGTFPTNPNPDLKPERARNIEAGFIQDFAAGRFSLSGLYFHNIFSNQIQFSFDPTTFVGKYINVNKALAHGAELEAHARISRSLSATASYTYTSTQALSAPLCSAGSGCTATGEPLLRRPRHLGQMLVTYTAPRWGASVQGSFVGRRPDNDFLFGAIPPVLFADAYQRVDVSAWRTLTHNVTAYASVYNALNQQYQEVVGYPALKANFRAGLRFTFGER